MTPPLIGLVIGILLGIANWVVVLRIAAKQERPGVRKLMTAIGWFDLVVLPAIGWFVGANFFEGAV